MRFNILILLFGFLFSYSSIAQEVKGRSKPISLNISKVEDGKIPKLEITKLFFKDNDLFNVGKILRFVCFDEEIIFLLILE